MTEVDGRMLLRLPARLFGDESAHGFAAIGDWDRDGTFDAIDLCPETLAGASKKQRYLDARQLDDDLDGLGDGVCDPGYCGIFTPPSPTRLTKKQARFQESLGEAALEYTEARVDATRRCLDLFLAGELTGKDPLRGATLLCRGNFVGGVPILPQNPDAANKIADATKALPDDLARRMIETYGESVNAVTNIVYGEPTKRPVHPEIEKRQAILGEAAGRYLTDILSAMQGCLNHRPRRDPKADDAALCLGELEGSLVLPANPGTAKRMEAARRRLRGGIEMACGERGASALTACSGYGSQNEGPEDRIVCTSWRRAVEAISSVYPAEIRRKMAAAHIRLRVPAR
jgi:hypothetical protein